MDGVECIPATEIVVANYAAEHTVFAAADAVDVVDGDLGEGRDIDFELRGWMP